MWRCGYVCWRCFTRWVRCKYIACPTLVFMYNFLLWCMSYVDLFWGLRLLTMGITIRILLHVLRVVDGCVVEVSLTAVELISRGWEYLNFRSESCVGISRRVVCAYLYNATLHIRTSRPAHTAGCITVNTRARSCTLQWARWVQFIFWHPRLTKDIVVPLLNQLSITTLRRVWEWINLGTRWTGVVRFTLRMHYTWE
jgi:hypothetical protein